MSGAVHRVLRAGLVVMAFVVAAVVFGAPPAKATAGLLQGRVTSSLTGQPRGGLTVSAYEAAYGQLRAQTTTAVDGSYALALVSGSYRIRVSDASGAFAPVYYGGSSTWLGSAVLYVPPTGATLDFGVAPLTRVAGTVRDAATTAVLAGMSVQVLEPVWGGVVASGTTAADGRYSVTVDPGTYRVRVSDPTSAHADRYSGGTTDWASSSTLVVGPPPPTTFDASLAAAGRVHGLVTDGAAPLAGVRVQLLDAIGFGHGDTTTGADGRYGFDGVQPGSYKMRFQDPAGARALTYDGGATTATTAVAFDVAAGADVSQDVAMSLAGRLSGSVQVGDAATGRGQAGMLVVAIDAAATEVSGLAISQAGGAWSMGGLPAGSFKVAVVDPAMLQPNPTRILRPVVIADWFAGGGPQRDAITEGFGALANGKSHAVANGATTPVTGAFLVGSDCDPSRNAVVAYPGSAPVGHSLPGANLAGLDLRGCSFAYSDLTGADLHGADLSDGDLVGSGVHAADLRGATLDRVTTFLSNVSSMPTGHADLSGARIAGASFRGARVSATYPLDKPQMLQTAPDWTGTDLRGTTDATYSPPCGCFLPGPAFVLGHQDLATLAAVTFRPADGATFSSGPFLLAGAGFQDAVLGDVPGADLHGLRCQGCTFANRDATYNASVPISAAGADLTGADLTGARFVAGADLSHAVLTGVTGNPAGGSGAVYVATTCPDGAITGTGGVTTCVGHGLAA